MTLPWLIDVHAPDHREDTFISEKGFVKVPSRWRRNCSTNVNSKSYRTRMELFLEQSNYNFIVKHDVKSFWKFLIIYLILCFYKTSLNLEKLFSSSNLKIFCHPNYISFQNVFKTIRISHMFKIILLLKIWVGGLLVDPLTRRRRWKRMYNLKLQVFKWDKIFLTHFPL